MGVRTEYYPFCRFQLLILRRVLKLDLAHLFNKDKIQTNKLQKNKIASQISGIYLQIKEFAVLVLSV